MNTREYLIEIQQQRGLTNNIAGTARLFDVSRQSVYDWLNGVSGFNEENAIRAADLLGLDHEEVLLNIKFEGTECPEVKAVWSSLLSRYHHTAAAVAGVSLGVALFFSSYSGQAISIM